MKIRIKYFAQLREEAGKTEEEIKNPPQTPADLYKLLSKKYTFSLSSEQIKVALNTEICDMDTSLSPDDEVVFIPPTSGG